MTTLAPDTVDVAPRARPVTRQVIMALARRESALLVRHPGFVAGFALTLLAYRLGYVSDHARVLSEDNGLTLPLLILCWTALIVTNVAALRTRRSDPTGELFDSFPTPPGVRTGAHLLSVVAAVPFALLLIAASYVVWRRAPGTVGSLPLLTVVVMLLLLVGAGVSGVLVARWVPFVLGGPLAVIATIVLQGNFGHEDPRWRWLHFGPGDAFSPRFDIGPYGWHVEYLVGLVLLGAVLALARHGMNARVVTAGAVSVGILVVSGWVQTRPPPAARVAARVDELENPAAHQTCEQRARARYCTYRTFRPWIRLWDEPVQGVLGRLPADVRDRGVELRQRAELSVALLPEVEARLDPAKAWAADGTVHPGLEWTMGKHHLTLAFQVAARAVGLPPAVDSTGAACVAGGQARVVVALWLAGQSTGDAEKALRARSSKVLGEGPRALVRAAPLDVLPDYAHEDRYPDTDYVPEVGAAGRGADVVAAVRLLDRPRERVGAVLSQHWALLTDPATPWRVVFDLVGGDAPTGVPDLTPVTPGVGSACR